MFDLGATGKLERALDVSMERHELLANNLANLHVAGAVRQDLDFEAALKETDKPVGDFVTHEGSPELSREASGIADTDTFYLVNARLLSMRFNGMRDAIK